VSRATDDGVRGAEATDADLSPAARDLLRADERVLHHERPTFPAFALPYAVRTVARFGAAGLALAGLALAVVGVLGVLALPLLGVLAAFGVVDPWALVGWTVLGVAVVVGAGVALAVLASYLPYRNAEYLVTTDRVVRFGGVAGRRAEFFDREAVMQTWVARNRASRLLGTGTLRVQTRGEEMRLRGLDDPSAVADRIQD
jgi:hypothetical protein